MSQTAISFPGYTVTELLHKSTNTAVYRGYRQQDSQPVVIKLLQAEYPTLKDIARFKHEYQIASSLNLTGVVKPYALVNYNNGLALILEDFGGESLNTIITSQKIELRDFLLIALKLADTLGELHTRNIIHKDIKPSNIIFNRETQTVKITDFSIASLLPLRTPKISNPNSLEGTLAYISPEQTGRMNRQIDYRTDFYSLGVTFYEMLVGQLPFTTTDALELVHCHIAKTPTSPHELNPAVPPMVSELVMKLLAKTAEARYQSAFGLKADLAECLTQLQTNNKIQTFLLGRQDKSGQFHIPEKLYGREAEVAQLIAAFDRVSSGSTEMMLVGGYSGIGKSSLVNEVHKPIVRQRGYFISGKFDQFKRNIPYASLIQAFQELMRQLLTESQSRIEFWKAKLLKAFGSLGKVIIDVIPEVELIVGKQPPVPELLPAESQNRFNLVFKKFIHVFTDAEHPLVLFLDDLQWADSASLKLIQLLITDPDSQYLLMLGAYRDNEVSVTHPLMLMLDEIRFAGADVGTITLGNLKLDNVSQLIADTLGEDTIPCQLPRTRIKPIAELVLAKTQGNPFFLTQLLKSLYQDNLLSFNFVKGTWEWDIEQLEGAAITDNVVELMLGKIQKLSNSTQQVLQLAACIGNGFELNTLALVSEQSPTATAAALWSALEAGLIIPLSNAYKIPTVLEQFDELAIDYKFLHDRVQQAAYALIPDDQKKSVHLKVGQLLLDNTQPHELEEHIFDIVNHLNIGVDLLSQQSEKERLAKLNLSAGHKAKTSTAYEAALKYLNVGTSILAEDSWKTQYELTLSLYLERIECEYLVGNFAQAEALVEIALEQAKSIYDKCDINNIRLVHYQNSARYESAIEVGMTSLKLFGLDLPYSPDEATISSAAASVKQNLGNRAIADLLDAPSLIDREAKTIIRLLMNLVPPTYLINQELLVLDVLKMTDICLQYGNDYLSVFVYVWYGTILCGNFNEYEAGYEFGCMALRLSEKFKDTSLKGKLHMSFGNFISHWRKHVRENNDIQAIAYQAAMESGDLSWCHHSALFAFWQKFVICQDLNSIPKEYEKYISFAREEATAAKALILQRNTLLNLKGLTKSKYSLSEDNFDESLALETFKQTRYDYGTNTYYFCKLLIYYVYENYADAYQVAIAAEKTITAINAQFQVALHYFYKSLTLLALYPTAPPQEKTAYWEILQNHRKKLKLWADNCPENFLANYLLVEAEVKRLLEENWQASELYEQAIASARQNQFIHTEALATELAAKFYLKIGREKIAKAYIKDARYIYLKWGATAKAKDLEAKYPQFFHSQTTQGDHSLTTTSTTTSFGSAGALDLATVIKASQALSEEIVLGNLLTSLMLIVLENAGAQTGFLILEKDGKLVIEASKTADSDVVVLQSMPLEPLASCIPPLPLSIINYAVRTQSDVVLKDASREGIFVTDTYIVSRKPKSVLCTPLIHQGQLTAILYLENNLIADAFTPQRLEVLKVLSSQAAISIEKARLYTDLEKANQNLKLSHKQLEDYSLSLEVKVEERTQELKEKEAAAQAANRAKSEFLANMSHELRTPLNGILGYAQILKKSKTLTEQQNNGLDIIRQCGEHLLTLINDILDISKIEARKMELHPTEFRLPEFLEGIAKICRIRAEEKGISLIYEPLTPLPNVIRADEKRLRQVLINLLGNAVKFTARGTVTFKVEVIKTGIGGELQPHAAHPTPRNPQPITKIRFQVEDTGIGIAPEQLEEIFLPFQQVGEPSRQTEGTGLGLAISRQLVLLMGGEIKVKSTQGLGSVFWLDLDLPEVSLKSKVANLSDGTLRERDRNIIGFKGTKRKILIVDDIAANRSVLVNLLSPLGFEVVEATDGLDALNKAGEFQPDCIFMDLVMPVINGFDATRRIRQMPDLKQVAIVATSASVFDFNQQESIDAGCDDFIAKPVIAEELLEKLRFHLDAEWIYEELTGDCLKAEDANSQSFTQNATLIAPPPEEISALFDLARIGDLGGIVKQADRLEQLNRQWVPFASHLRQLAKNFEDKKILNFIKQYKES